MLGSAYAVEQRVVANKVSFALVTRPLSKGGRAEIFRLDNLGVVSVRYGKGWLTYSIGYVEWLISTVTVGC